MACAALSFMVVLALVRELTPYERHKAFELLQIGDYSEGMLPVS